MQFKTYKLYLDIGEPNASGNYLSIFAGSATGNIDSGAMTVSNKTGGVGNLNGFIHPETKGVFTLLKTLGVFISTDGHRMTFQNKLGGNPLTFIRGFLEFVLQEEIVSIEGDVYEAVDFGKKGFLVRYTKKNGREGRATMTNSVKEGFETAGKILASPVTAPVTSTKTAIQDPTTGNIVKASTVDALTAVTIGMMGASAFGEGADDEEAVEGGVVLDAAVDDTIEDLTSQANSIEKNLNRMLEDEKPVTDRKEYERDAEGKITGLKKPTLTKNTALDDTDLVKSTQKQLESIKKTISRLKTNPPKSMEEVEKMSPNVKELITKNIDMRTPDENIVNAVSSVKQDLESQISMLEKEGKDTSELEKELYVLKTSNLQTEKELEDFLTSGQTKETADLITKKFGDEFTGETQEEQVTFFRKQILPIIKSDPSNVLRSVGGKVSSALEDSMQTVEPVVKPQEVVTVADKTIAQGASTVSRITKTATAYVVGGASDEVTKLFH